jgi:PilZ domain
LSEERRRTPRYPFIATAEVIAKGKPAGLSARMTELSLYGCYIEMPDPLAAGTEVTLKLYSSGRFFESPAMVVYAQEKQGFGARFQNVNPHFLTVLRQWLIEAAQAKYGKKE